MEGITRLDLPYVQAAGDGGHRSLTQLIVIHATDNTASAEGEAAYAAHRPDETSCHVFVDADSAVQVNLLDHIAFGCFPEGNSRSIQFELCGISNQLSSTVIARAAELVAQVAKSWGIPPVRPSVEQMRAGVPGIVGHVDVTNAWHQGDHTDPGSAFPWSSFLAQVSLAMTNGEDDMLTNDQDHALSETWAATAALRDGNDVQATPTFGGGPHHVVTQLKHIRDTCDAILAAIQAGTPPAGLVPHTHTLAGQTGPAQ